MVDGMSFVFQIDSNTPGLEELLGRLDKSNVAMEKSKSHLKGVDQGMRAAGEGAKTLGDRFSDLITKGLDPFLERAKSIAEFEFIREGTQKLLELPGELAHEVFKLGEEALMTAAKSERMRRAFENALGADVGRNTFNYFDDIAEKTEYSHEQIKGMGLELSKSGFKGEGLKNAIAAVADLGSMSGNPEEGGFAAVSALQRIITTGRLEARQLMPFGIHKEEFLGELGKETGIMPTQTEAGMKALHKALEDGKIPIETTLNSLYTTITNKTGKDLGGAGTEMTDLLTARLKHLSEKPEEFFAGMKDTTGYKDISEFVQRLNESLNPESPLGKILSSALTTAFGEVGETLKGIDLEAVFTTAADIIKGIPDDIRMVGAIIRDDVIPAIKEMASWIMPMFDAIGTTVTGLKTAANAIHDYTPVGAITDLANNKKHGWMSASDAAGSLAAEGRLPSQQDNGAAANWLNRNTPVGWLNDRVLNPEFWKRRFGGGNAAPPADAGSNDVKGYAHGVEASTPEATGAIVAMADATTSALKDAHEQHSPSELFAGIGENDAAGYIAGIEDSRGRIADAMDVAFSPQGDGSAISTSAGAGISISFGDINITVEGGAGGRGGHELGEDIVEALRERMVAELTRALEDISAQQGG